MTKFCAMSKILSYLKEVEQNHLSNIAREHAYRGFLQNLLHQILPEEIRATNEPARISCGSPDYVLTKKNIPVGYIEAKDLGANLADKKHQEQLDRYRFSLPNFIFTNYLDFHFYRDGSFVTAISIAKITPENIAAIPANFEQFDLRKSRGVWNTPQPVVNFIVRATDEILKSEFGLKDGLADTTKIKKKISSGLVDKRTKDGYSADEKEFHKAQILDPATGTGTFLTEAMREQRFKIFLTNSLEEANPDQNVPLLAFMRELTIEGLEAAKVKNETPVMVILGNPPYSGESQNKSDWIKKLMEDYKKEPNSNEKLKEKNPKWINDDYVKFLRFGQYFIEKNGEGILAFINPHGFLDNPTFRGMRWSFSELDIAPSPLAGEGWGEGFGSNHPYQSPNHRTYASYFKTFSRSLRKNQSDAEAKLWNLVRNNQPPKNHCGSK